MRHTRLTPLGRLVALVLAISLGAVVGAAGAAATRPHSQEWRCVAVRSGDTLWALAKESSERDPRDAVHRIVRENGLAGGSIQPGMALWVPNERSGSLHELDPARCEKGA